MVSLQVKGSVSPKIQKHNTWYIQYYFVIYVTGTNNEYNVLIIITVTVSIVACRPPKLACFQPFWQNKKLQSALKLCSVSPAKLYHHRSDLIPSHPPSHFALCLNVMCACTVECTEWTPGRSEAEKQGAPPFIIN